MHFRDLMTPVQNLIDTIDAISGDINGNLGKLERSISNLLGLPAGVLTFTYTPADEDFLMRFKFDKNVQVGGVEICKCRRIICSHQEVLSPPAHRLAELMKVNNHSGFETADTDCVCHGPF